MDNLSIQLLVLELNVSLSVVAFSIAPQFSHWQKCKFHQLSFNHLPECHRPQIFTGLTPQTELFVKPWNSSQTQSRLDPWLFSCTRPKSVLLSWALVFLHPLKRFVCFSISIFSHHSYLIPTHLSYSSDISKAVFQFWLYLKLWMLPDVLRRIETTECLLSCTDNFSKVIKDYRSLKGTNVLLGSTTYK